MVSPECAASIPVKYGVKNLKRVGAIPCKLGSQPVRT